LGGDNPFEPESKELKPFVVVEATQSVDCVIRTLVTGMGHQSIKFWVKLV